MHNKTVADPFAFASPFGGIDTSKGPIATARRAAAMSLALQRAPLSWSDAQVFKLADTIVEYISGERAEEAKPAPATLPPALAAEGAAYEVRDPATGNAWVRIYASGRAEGLPLGATINRIPRLIAEAKAEGAGLKGFPHPLGHTPVEAIKDSAGRIFVWDNLAGTHREVVYK